MTYDFVVIGGGPAGMMAAGRAGERGARVLLLEKNSSLGIKLLATGNGRCNLSNIAATEKPNIGVYGPNGKFLFSAFNKFGVNDVLEFLTGWGVMTKIEAKGRIFPSSNRAADVRDAFVEYLAKNKVEVRSGVSVKGFVAGNNKIEKVLLVNGEFVIGKNFLIAVGGKSYPGTGSTGDGYVWLTGLGHTINKPRPALTPLKVKENFIKQLEGLSLSEVVLNVYHDNKKKFSGQGDIIFTANGLSGPAIIDLSSRIGSLLSSTVMIGIDLIPDIKADALDKKIQQEMHTSHNKIVKNYLAALVPSKLVTVLIKLTGIDSNQRISEITKAQRKRLVELIKSFKLEIGGLMDFDRAMLTAGGIEVKEVDPKTMRSRFYDNLFLAGEILDVDGPSGGYNLQMCWSTGYTAGDSVEF